MHLGHSHGRHRACNAGCASLLRGFDETAGSDVTKRILLVSNGHGEDAEAAAIARAVREAGLPVEMSAVAMVGEGRAYMAAGVPLVGPTFMPPSNGFSYMDRKLLIADLRAGLIGATFRQWRAVRRAARQCDLVLGVGDEFCQLVAWSAGRPFIAYVPPHSALYEGDINLDLILIAAMRSRRCLKMLTKDPATAEVLQRKGYDKVAYGGNPSVDFLLPSGVDLDIPDGADVVGLLPGSRPPEADRNFLLQMRLVEKVAVLAAAAGRPAPAFRAALVPKLFASAPALAAQGGWSMDAAGHRMRGPGGAAIGLWTDAFADIIDASRIVVAMAGQASDQALALGKPSLLIAGEGPQFSWRFAEAQNRLHGGLSRLVGTGAADEATLDEAARALLDGLAHKDWLAAAATQGPLRMGSRGSAARFVAVIREALAI